MIRESGLADEPPRVTAARQTRVAKKWSKVLDTPGDIDKAWRLLDKALQWRST